MLDSDNNLQKSQIGAIVSIVAYVLLTILKIGVGFLAGSTALIADGLNNATDIFVSITILIGLRVSVKPPDHNHPYGHRRSEGIASLIAAFVMATVGIQVIIQALRSIFWTPVTTPPDMISAWAALFSAAAMLLVYRFNANLAKRTRSSSLQAASKDNLSDALVSLGAAAGIFGSQVGAPWLDPLAAVVVGGIICKTAWEIFSDSAYQLTDGFNKADINRYRDTIKNVKGVKLIKDIKARKHGNLIFVDTVIQVHPEMDVIESHRITDRIEKLMRERHHVAHTHIHVEPITHVRLKHGE